MKVYLAGPMRYYKGYNFQAFIDEAARLRAAGHEVVSPAEMDMEKYPHINWLELDGEDHPDIPDFSIEDTLFNDFRQIVYNVDGIALLPGWSKSSGATAEFFVANCFRREVLYCEGAEEFKELVAA